MLWEASMDQNNIINGKTYSANIMEMIKKYGPTAPSVSLPVGPPAPPPNPSKYDLIT